MEEDKKKLNQRKTTAAGEKRCGEKWNRREGPGGLPPCRRSHVQTRVLGSGVARVCASRVTDVNGGQRLINPDGLRDKEGGGGLAESESPAPLLCGLMRGRGGGRRCGPPLLPPKPTLEDPPPRVNPRASLPPASCGFHPWEAPAGDAGAEAERG